MHLSQEVALSATLRAADDLARAARAVPPERHRWQPGGVARNLLWILAHCAAENRFFAAIYSGAPLPYRTQDEREAAVGACDTLERAQSFLGTSVTELCNAIAALPDNRLSELMVMPWGERLPMALGLLAPAQHMQYHQGQVNLIQALLGDDEHH
ncbi:MAG: DinB family protein [Chthonomonadales bacterium]|nr:DinB family protein [Chthonomonadales bacterium]